MAERLAPEQSTLRITSRPERPRGRARRWTGRVLALGLVVALLAAGSLVTLHFLAIHRTATTLRATALIPPELPASVLVVVARPGQELPMAGTLAELDDAGARVAVLSLTKGEAQPPAIDFAADRLGGIRADELASAADLLGVDEVTTGGYADGDLLAAEPAEVTAAITSAAKAAAASIILTVSDITGTDPDSQATAAYAVAAAQAEGSGVARVWTVTRGDRELSWGGLVSDQMAGGRQPEPQVSVRIDAQTTTKGEALLAHGTQSPDLVQATYPFADTLPAWAFFRFWDREYFALTWGQPLE
jgi:LmbE family N-acetylglucosaminyl deacetylase